MTARASASDEPAGILGPMFDLTQDEADRLLLALDEALQGQGLEPSRFLNAFAGGASLAGALGIPTSALEVIYARAHQWFSIGRVDRAEPLFRALCAGDGTVADHWVGHGVCLRVLGDASGARLALETAHGLRPDWSVPCIHLAELAALRGDGGNARHWLQAFRARADETTPAPLVRDARRLEDALSAPRAGA